MDSSPSASTTPAPAAAAPAASAPRDAAPIETIAALRVVPIVILDDAARALPLGEALVRGGLPCLEVTLRTPAALDAIAALAQSDLDVLVGAGTVRTVADVRASVDAGARFLVSAGLKRDVVDAARELGVPIVPGACTPTEIEHALTLGLSTVKFFPADAFGGPAALRALSGPIPDVRFVPTSGVTPDTMADYLGVPAVLAVGGTWIAAPALIAAGDWGTIERLAAEAVATARGRV